MSPLLKPIELKALSNSRETAGCGPFIKNSRNNVIITGFSKYAFCNNLEIYRTITRSAPRKSKQMKAKPPFSGYFEGVPPISHPKRPFWGNLATRPNQNVRGTPCPGPPPRPQFPFRPTAAPTYHP